MSSSVDVGAKPLIYSRKAKIVSRLTCNTGIPDTGIPRTLDTDRVSQFTRFCKRQLFSANTTGSSASKAVVGACNTQAGTPRICTSSSFAYRNIAPASTGKP